MDVKKSPLDLLICSQSTVILYLSTIIIYVCNNSFLIFLKRRDVRYVFVSRVISLQEASDFSCCISHKFLSSTILFYYCPLTCSLRLVAKQCISYCDHTPYFNFMIIHLHSFSFLKKFRRNILQGKLSFNIELDNVFYLFVFIIYTLFYYHSFSL